MKIAIASGKGGTGKTLVSTNLFWVAQQAGKAVCIVDCDAEEPNVRLFLEAEPKAEKIVKQHVPIIDSNACVFCGKCAEYCNYNAIVFVPNLKHIRVMEDLCHDCGACVYACNFSAITEKEKIVGQITELQYSEQSQIIECRTQVGIHSPVAVIRQAISELAPSQLALLDSPPGISCPFIATVEQADFILLVTEPTPFGLNDLKLSVETLQSMHKHFAVIINKAGLGNNEMYHWLALENISIIQEIPFDKDLAMLYSEGQIASAHKEQYRMLFEKLWERIELVNTTAI